MSRLMTLMLTGDTTPERLRLLADRHLDRLASCGPTPQLRADVAEIATLARAAADRSDADPAWGRPSSTTALARLQAEVLYSILGAEDAWRTGVFNGKGPDAPDVQVRQRQVREHLVYIRAYLHAPAWVSDLRVGDRVTVDTEDGTITRILSRGYEVLLDSSRTRTYCDLCDIPARMHTASTL